MNATNFPIDSRYYNQELATLVAPDGTQTAYLVRRFVPQPERFALLQYHTVAQEDRLDNLSSQFFGDPLLFWRLCDANRAMLPDDLTSIPGRRLRITLPEGIPAMPNS
jgi:hypothetical protein